MPNTPALSAADAAVVAWTIYHYAREGCWEIPAGHEPCAWCLTNAAANFSDLMALVVAVRAGMTALVPLARLGAWLLDGRNAERYPDGFDVQDEAVKVGAIHPVPVTEPCVKDGAGCRCWEYDNLPGDCYRETEAVTEARAALRAAGGDNGK